MSLVVLYFVCNILVIAYGTNPDLRLNIEQQIQKQGYPVELHQVVTKDDYILNLYRIPHGLGKSEKESRNKSAVLFAHGLAGSPHNFIALGKKVAPAYYFADRDFDVWLFCARGVECQNPRKHKSLDWNRDPIYWDFSLHEIGIYDLSASIDLILDKTGQKQIFYIGHAAAGPVFYALMSERPEYNNKIKINTNYAAVAILRDVDYPFWQVLAQLSSIYKNLFKTMGMYELLPGFVSEMLGDALPKLCAEQKWFKLCKVTLWCFASHISPLLEDDIVEPAFSIMPRFSIKHLTHFMDNMNRGDFRKYDYGPKKNMAVYGNKLPPAYNLGGCTVPNAFFYGANDAFATPADVWTTQDMLPNTIFDYELGPKFVQLDFIFAKNATHMLYDPTIKLFRDFDAGIIPPKVMRKKRNE